MNLENEYQIRGMTCEACARRIERKINQLEGVKAKVSFATESAIIEIPNSQTLSKISKTLSDMGYELILPHTKEETFSLFPLWISLSCTFLLMLPMFLMPFHIHFSIPPLLQMTLAFVVMFTIGKNFFKSAFYTLLDKSTNMDVLVSLGSISAFVLSLLQMFFGNQNELYFESTAAILSFVGLGKYLEKKAKHKATDLFQKLLSSLPNEARVFRNETWVVVPTKEIQIKEKIKVLAGEKIPCDGKILDGKANVEDAIFSGESIPTLKQEGDSVLAGSLCLDGVLILEVLSSSSKLEKSFYLLQESLATKPKIQLLVDKVSSVFVPFIILISLITFCAWIILKGDWTQALLSSISVLVISCPCALGLATPTALLVGNSLALSKGILFKNSDTLEYLDKLNLIFWDKTGTLTKGKPSVVHASHSLSSKEKEILSALVSSSFHPFSLAIKNYFQFQESNITLNNIQVLSGVGIQAEFEKEIYALVSEKYLIENNITYSNWSENYASSFFIKGNQILCAFFFEDEIRKEAKETIQRLKSLKIESSILSGDRNEVVRQVAKELSLEFALGRLSPEEKQKEIQKAKQEGKIVGMIGDGVNDIHALLHADISFSLSTGTEISKEAADVTITEENILLVVEAIQVGKKILKKIKQNLFFAFLYNSLCIPLAAFGYFNPTLAGIAMSFSSVSVILNSLLLRKNS